MRPLLLSRPRAPRDAALGSHGGYCGQLAEIILTDVTVKVVGDPMLDAAGLVACPGCVLPGRPGVVLDVPVPDVLPAVPVVVLDVDDDVEAAKVPVTST